MPSQPHFSGKGFGRILKRAVSYITGTANVINNAIQEQLHATVTIHSSHNVPQVVRYANNRSRTKFRKRNGMRYSF